MKDYSLSINLKDDKFVFLSYISICELYDSYMQT